MRKLSIFCIAAVIAFAGIGYSAPTHYLFYAGGAILDSGDAILEDGTLSTDNAVFSVLVADVELSGGSVTISNWRAAGQLPTTNPNSSNLMSWMYMGAAVSFCNGYLYVGPGDWNGDSTRDTADFVAYAPVDWDGSLGTFQLSAEFPSPPVDQAICPSVIVDFGGGNAYLYVLGGTNAYSTRVLKSKIQSDGSLGAWTTDTPLLAGMWFNRAVVSGTTIINGYGHPSTLDRRIITAAPSASDGSIPSWTDQGLYDTTAGGRWDYAMTTVESGGNTYLVIAGGNTGGGVINDVRVAPVASGVPGTWSAGGTIAAACRALTGCSVGNFVIISGGATSGGAAGAFDTINIGEVDSSGNITWTTSSTPMLRAQGFGGAVIVDVNDLPAPPTPTPIPLGAINWTLYE
jgi:hypothetical protein